MTPTARATSRWVCTPALDRLVRAVLWLLAFGCFGSFGYAGDWPQILGPKRNGVAQDEKIVESFPAAGPTVRFKKTVGEGFAGVAIIGEHGFIFHRQGDREIAECFATRDGNTVWKKDFPASYRGAIAPDNGPRCVPVVHKNVVLFHGAAGHLHNIDRQSGQVNWSRDLYKDYKGSEGYFGAGSTPIVADNKVLLNTGGAKGAGITALDLQTGELAWNSTDEQASYSSPILTTIGQQEVVIFITRLNCVAIRPQDGSALWRIPFGARGPTVNAASPLVVNNHLFLTASYGVGAQWIEFNAKSTSTKWESNDVLSSQYTSVIHHDGFLYGTDGRSDQPGSRLRCVEAATGKVRWTEEEFPVSHGILADGKLILIQEGGTLVLVRPDPSGYQELGRHRILTGVVRALPALSQGALFVRDNQSLACVELGR